MVRLVGSTAIGVAFGFGVAQFAPWQFAALAGWDAVACAFLVWVWLPVRRFDPEGTAAHATREDSSRVAADFIVVAAGIASLFGVGLDLVKAGTADGQGRLALVLVSVVSVALSWSVVHTVFMLHYARSYYAEPQGGIDFKSEEKPDYLDFAYVAFTVGMTFQVSDTDIQQRRIRRIVLRQALVAYVFGAVILAVTVNVIGSIT